MINNHFSFRVRVSRQESTFFIRTPDAKALSLSVSLSHLSLSLSDNYAPFFSFKLVSVLVTENWGVIGQENRDIPIVSLASKGSDLAIADEELMFRDGGLPGGVLSLEICKQYVVITWQD